MESLFRKEPVKAMSGIKRFQRYATGFDRLLNLGASYDLSTERDVLSLLRDRVALEHDLERLGIDFSIAIAKLEAEIAKEAKDQAGNAKSQGTSISKSPTNSEKNVSTKAT